jgi:3-oxoacid CoA-transferase subunit B
MALNKNQIAKRIAQELQNGFYVNLGIGIPTFVANFVPVGIQLEFQSENGILGVGPFPDAGEEDPDIINASKETITTLGSSSFFDAATSFGMIRGKHIDLTVLGSYAGRSARKYSQLENSRKISEGYGRRNGSGRFRKTNYCSDDAY